MVSPFLKLLNKILVKSRFRDDLCSVRNYWCVLFVNSRLRTEYQIQIPFMKKQLPYCAEDRRMPRRTPVFRLSQQMSAPNFKEVSRFI